jgi:hypothetical protein
MIKKMKQRKIEKGMELVRGGIKATEDAGILGCICSPGGWSYGSSSSSHCACGCRNGNSGENMSANHALAK